MKDFGFEEGDVCGRDRCAGRIETRSAENCSCHLSAPCGACTAPRNFCPECDWDEVDEPVEPMPKAAAQPYVWPELRPLDPTRINWRNYAHSSFSMIKEGVYPEGAARSLMRIASYAAPLVWRDLMSEEEAEAIQYAVDGIDEAFILGGLNESRPEKGHWLERWWNLGRNHQALLDLAKARLAELDFLDTPTDAQRAERAELFALLQRVRGE